METGTIEWNGSDLPQALRALPPGRYLVEALDEPLTLTPKQDAGLMRAMDQLDSGQGRPLEEVLACLRASLKRQRRFCSPLTPSRAQLMRASSSRRTSRRRR
jgi:hypothetical protein